MTGWLALTLFVWNTEQAKGFLKLCLTLSLSVNVSERKKKKHMHNYKIMH